MTKDDLNQLVTINDLEIFRYKLMKDLKAALQTANPTEKKFYTPKEFSKITGIAYSSIVYRCSTGKLKARQDEPKCSWQICASEIERYKAESIV